MVKNLNETLGLSEQDNLVYDATYPIDAKVVSVTLDGNTKKGTIARGRLLDLADGDYGLHTAGGKANVIVAQDTEYGADETSVAVPVYVSGTFRQNCIISDVDLVADDIEKLRSVGIVLK